VVTTAALGGAAVVAFAVGAYLGVKSRDDAHAADAIRNDGTRTKSTCFMNPTFPGCANLDRTVNDQNREAIASDALYVSAGVLAAGALAAWFLWPKRPPTVWAQVWVAPSVGPTTMGLNARIRF
jgi:hypothetical protein